jgi:hypothetical protein
MLHRITEITEMYKVFLSDAVSMLAASVGQETMGNCYRKAGFNKWPEKYDNDDAKVTVRIWVDVQEIMDTPHLPNYKTIF